MAAPTPAPDRPIRNSYWVLPGKVLAGEHPSGTTVDATRDKLTRLMNAGVECFIDLTESDELKSYDSELPFGIEYLRKPIRDHGVPAQRAHMAEILDCLHDALQSGRGVYVHCRAGIGRTGTVVGCFLVERGLAGEAALDQLNQLWQQCERSQTWPSVPETDDQAGYVRRWKARAVPDDRGQLKTPSPRSARPSEPDASRGQTARDSTGVESGARAGRNAGTTGATAGGGETPWAHLLLDDSPAEAPAIPVAHAGSDRREARAPGSAAAAVPRGSTANLFAAPASVTRGEGVVRPAITPGTPSLFADPASVAQAVAGPAPAESVRSPDLRQSERLSHVDPLSDPAALAAASHLRARFLGALLGLATGDAVAAATQFRRPGTFTPVGDMLGGGPFDLPRGAWSDDTAMTLCLADSLLERDSFDARDQVERYRRWQQEGYLSATGQCVGITASSARAIAMAQWRRQAFAGSHDPAQLDPDPLSRVAAAVLFFFATSGQAIEQATEAARTTCQAPAVLDACRSLARALYAALSGQPKAVVLDKAAAVTAAAAGNAGSSGLGQAALGNSQDVRTGSSAQGALAAAVAAFGATDNFRDAILYAVNLGGDSDVVAAVCGQLAGAYYGVKAIPTSWYNGLMQKELITNYADRLLAHALLGLSG